MHDDLLVQARQLATLDPGRPRQTNLRRAVSSAYYAIFHFLVDLTERFNRSDVLGLVQQAETSIRQFRQLAASSEKKFFLACLWAWNTLSRR